MTEPEVDLSACRENIVGLIRILASGAEQLEYQRRVPWVDVSTELIAQWFDDMYHPQDERWRALFTPPELRALEQLDSEFSHVVPDLTAGSIEQLQMDPNWKRVMHAAAIALTAFSIDSL